MLPISADDYQAHPLHDPDQPWPETNCYTDLWIELLHSFGCEPRAALAFLLSTDFDGDQWQFFKVPPEDIRTLYGVEVNEMNVWRPIIDHIGIHLALGQLLTVEVDSFHLPDTLGTSYGTIHQKSTIVVNVLDRDARRIEYFHNGGYYTLGEPDYSHVLRLRPLPVEAMVPYAEVVDVSSLRKDDIHDVMAVTRRLVRDHLGRRPQSNPVARLAEQVAADVPWLREQGIDVFHQYAFGTLRQCGAWAGTTAGFVTWLGEHDAVLDTTNIERLNVASTSLNQIANGAKTAQFQLARAAAGRSVDLGTTFAPMVDAYVAALDALVVVYGNDASV